jgi:hypothetical protein
MSSLKSLDYCDGHSRSYSAADSGGDLVGPRWNGVDGRDGIGLALRVVHDLGDSLLGVRWLARWREKAGEEIQLTASWPCCSFMTSVFPGCTRTLSAVRDGCSAGVTIAAVSLGAASPGVAADSEKPAQSAATARAETTLFLCMMSDPPRLSVRCSLRGGRCSRARSEDVNMGGEVRRNREDVIRGTPAVNGGGENRNIPSNGSARNIAHLFSLRPLEWSSTAVRGRDAQE